MTGDKPIADTWFSIEAYPGVLRFREHNIDSYAVGDLWLLRGSERALLIDTGSGIVSPEPLVTAVAGMPVTAVALNSYYDHAGGWSAFAERACHRLDAPALAKPMEENASFGIYLNRRTLWALPHPGYSLEDYTLAPAAPTRLVEDGDLFDLGDRQIEVLHVPGRSPGGLALFEAASGSLFTSDMLFDGDHGPSWPPPEPEAYCKSLERMRALAFRTVYPGHYGLIERPRALAIIDAQLADLTPHCPGHINPR
ncbi:MAG: MBL fold metallo-hydrolase [Kiloniellales bacterium]